MTEGLDPDRLLRLVQAERQAAVSLETDAELRDSHQQALNYYKGEMPDVPVLEGRSRAVSTDISDAVETVLPDLIEIFTGGEDVATFAPHGPEDEAAARQESDYVQHVVFNENPGFLILYSAFKDALLSKIGVFKFWREDVSEHETLALTGKTATELQLALQDGWALAAELRPSAFASAPAMPGQPPEPLYDADLVRARPRAVTRIMTVPPEDFGVARDTVLLKDATYCFMRSRPRAQELIAQGYDPELVDDLPACPDTDEEGVGLARDTAGESSVSTSDTTHEMRRVEVHEHYLRVLEEGRLCLWRLVTGKDETVLLEASRVEAIPFAAITPYVVTHRFFGRSLADLLIQVQQVRTALTRMMLDSGYFALNQRMQIATDRCGETTVEDYLDNRPNRPILSPQGDAVVPIQSGGLSFDAFAALEYTATLAEQRTGVVRNAQGLNPDTLHDTASGALALMSAAQKRVRMIARIFAETGVRDLFLGVHALLREGPAQPATVRLRGSWVAVDPTGWGARNDMDISIGVGSGGRQHDIAAMQGVLGLQEKLHQAGAGAMVSPQNIYAAARRLIERSGVKGAEQFLTAPPPGPPPPPPPNPAAVEAQQKLGLEQQKAQMKADNDRLKIQLEHARAQQQMAAEVALRREQLKLDAQARAIAGLTRADRPVMIGGEPG